jgi:hypothetical protein
MSAKNRLHIMKKPCNVSSLRCFTNHTARIIWRERGSGLPKSREVVKFVRPEIPKATLSGGFLRLEVAMQVAPRFAPPLTMREERAQLAKLHDERQKQSDKADPAWLAAFYKRLTS